MDLMEHARTELERAGLMDEESDYGGMLGTAVLELVEKFSDQGHSGFSAVMALDIFSKVAAYQPLTPLTGEDDEWNHLDYGPELKAQNKRRSSVFMEGDGLCYDIDAVVVRDPRGHTWGSKVRDPIEFPYWPSTRVIEIDQHGRALNRDEARYDVEGFCDDDGCNCWRGEPPISIPI